MSKVQSKQKLGNNNLKMRAEMNEIENRKTIEKMKKNPRISVLKRKTKVAKL